MDFYSKSYTFGGKSRAQTRNKVINSVLISNNLADLCQEYYPHPKIQHLLNIKTQDHYKNGKFQVLIGNAESYDKHLKQKRIKFNNENDSLEKSLTSFFESVFDGEELANKIRLLLDSNDILIIIITKKTTSSRSRSNQVTTDDIIAAAMYIPDKYCNFLQLIGVSNQQFLSKTFSMHYGIGTFLLATMDQIAKGVHKFDRPIICQVQQDSSMLQFYEINYFHDINKNGPTVKKIESKYPTLINPDQTLKWIQSVGPIFPLTGYWCNTCKKIDAIYKIFEIGTLIFFGSDPHDHISKEKEFSEVVPLILKRFNCDSWDTIPSSIYLTRHDPDKSYNPEGIEYIENRWCTKDSVTRAGDEMIESFLHEENQNKKTLFLYDQGQGKDEEANCSFIIMSILLLKNRTKCYLFRYFLSFINR